MLARRAGAELVALAMPVVIVAVMVAFFFNPAYVALEQDRAQADAWTGFTRDEVNDLKGAYRLIYRSALPWEEMLSQLRDQFSAGPAAEFPEFFAGGRRGFTPERRQALSLRLHDEGEDESLRAAA